MRYLLDKNWGVLDLTSGLYSTRPRSQALAWERGSLKLCFDAQQALAAHHVDSEVGWRVSFECRVLEAELPECAFPSGSLGTSEMRDCTRLGPTIWRSSLQQSSFGRLGSYWKTELGLDLQSETAIGLGSFGTVSNRCWLGSFSFPIRSYALCSIKATFD